MKVKLGVIIFVIQLLLSSSTWAAKWGELGQDQKASYLEELYYYSDGLGVEDVEVISIDTDNLLLNSRYHGKYSHYINKLFEVFQKNVDREAIEQFEGAPLAQGPEVSSLILVIDSDQNIIGSVLAAIQRGVDEQGDTGDISWSAWLRADENAQVLKNNLGQVYDDLYYEWSGY